MAAFAFFHVFGATCLLSTPYSFFSGSFFCYRAPHRFAPFRFRFAKKALILEGPISAQEGPFSDAIVVFFSPGFVLTKAALPSSGDRGSKSPWFPGSLS